MAELLSRIVRLEEFPESGLIVPEFGNEHVREIIHLPFRIVYRCDKKRVRIIRLWRSERIMKLP
ncbi:MAG: type II toxin-antitoxin system RelE/ParE family toxin [Candidatus Eremiobacteraeota bacterium]|nr:type II toxin-antitoxin system RelE/ParE family toxin [Candidatus Eremiobacteraeota bacterium]